LDSTYRRYILFARGVLAGIKFLILLFMDKLSTTRIALLHPDLRIEATEILQRCDQALTGRAKVRFTYTLRTAGEQNGLYALGRTAVNPDGKSKQRPMGYKVTNAPAWSSMHNYGLAIDIALIIDGKIASWDDTKDWDADRVNDWMEVVHIFEAYGWTWGGRWSSIIDKPHFQKTFGLSLKQLQSLHTAKRFIGTSSYVKISPTVEKSLYTTTELNLRSGAGTQYQVIRALPKSTQVIELEVNGSWSKVEVGKLIGWVSNVYLK
jgi:peptidoglycan L-alanyl-D-glutamate endopeptidase CwlK